MSCAVDLVVHLLMMSVCSGTRCAEGCGDGGEDSRALYRPVLFHCFPPAPTHPETGSIMRRDLKRISLRPQSSPVFVHKESEQLMTAAVSQGPPLPPAETPPGPAGAGQTHQQQHEWFPLPGSPLASLQRPFIWSIISSRCDPRTNPPSRGADCRALNAAPTDLASRRISCTEKHAVAGFPGTPWAAPSCPVSGLPSGKSLCALKFAMALARPSP